MASQPWKQEVYNQLKNINEPSSPRQCAEQFRAKLQTQTLLQPPMTEGELYKHQPVKSLSHSEWPAS